MINQGKNICASREAELNIVALKFVYVSKSFCKIQPVDICKVIYLQFMLDTC